MKFFFTILFFIYGNLLIAKDGISDGPMTINQIAYFLGTVFFFMLLVVVIIFGINTNAFKTFLKHKLLKIICLKKNH